MSLPTYTVVVCRTGDTLRAEAEEMFADELAHSRRCVDSPDGPWRFINVCAVTDDDHVLGGAHLDTGPISFGPLAAEKLAYLEMARVRPAYRGHGLGTKLLGIACQAAREAGCLYVRCNVRWDNPAAIRMYRKCGFALADISEEGGEYFAMRPL